MSNIELSQEVSDLVGVPRCARVEHSEEIVCSHDRFLRSKTRKEKHRFGQKRAIIRNNIHVWQNSRRAFVLGALLVY